MVSLSILSSSRASSIRSSRSQNSINHVPPSPVSSNGHSTSSSSSSSGSLKYQDAENVTITPNRPLNMEEKQKSQEDLRLLAVSTHITELSYNISDIQTRIFEIQELRHKSQSSSDAANASSVIDQSLLNLDERVQSVSKGIKIVRESLEPLLQQTEKTPIFRMAEPNEDAALLRKHATLVADWEAVQKDIQVLREELKEDKWLTVFRTVTEQADGMMCSLEKAVNRCQDFIWQAQRREDSISQTSSTSSMRSEKNPLSLEVFNSLLDSFEAKKKHYMPATTKVLSIIDKGVQDRVTKNGECLRRHAESTQRWKNLKERIARTEIEMEAMRRLLLSLDVAPSEVGSSTSEATSMSKNGYLATPPSLSRSQKDHGSTISLSNSISPFRKLARKLAGSKSPRSPVPESQKKSFANTPSLAPQRTLKHRSSMLHFLNGPPTPVTPSHKHSQSLTPESSPSARKLDPRLDPRYDLRAESRADSSNTVKSRPAWNSSTRVEAEERSLTLKSQAQRRTSTPGLSGYYEDIPPVPSLYPYNRSVSRSSMASSRPWSPVTSSASTGQSSTPGMSMFRPPSRTQSNQTSSGFFHRIRPTTPSHIPAPSLSHWPSDQSPTTLMQCALSPAQLTPPRSHTPGGSVIPARPPSRSMIPIPSVHVSAASRPSSAMSYYRPDSSMSFRTSAVRAQTPEGILRMTPRPSRLPPSSFRESISPRTPGSRPGSRAGAATPIEANGYGPVHVYVPTNSKDPLDAEVAAVVNTMSHGLLIERVDPPLRTVPREGEEIRAQYAFTNQIARKVVTCKLTTLVRSGAKGSVTQKVMCRVGGGWQDLPVYVMSRQK
ncbi:hypothetical protein BKA93DRAFT_741314 [Sparassis latifolia]